MRALTIIGYSFIIREEIQFFICYSRGMKSEENAKANCTFFHILEHCPYFVDLIKNKKVLYLYLDKIGWKQQIEL